jgi:hypothetical protein
MDLWTRAHTCSLSDELCDGLCDIASLHELIRTDVLPFAILDPKQQDLRLELQIPLGTTWTNGKKLKTFHWTVDSQISSVLFGTVVRPR